jgi:hypothetical protein
LKNLDCLKYFSTFCSINCLSSQIAMTLDTNYRPRVATIRYMNDKHSHWQTSSIHIATWSTHMNYMQTHTPTLYTSILCTYVALHACIHTYFLVKKKAKAVPLHAMEALGGRGGIAPIHSRPRH